MEGQDVVQPAAPDLPPELLSRILHHLPTFPARPFDHSLSPSILAILAFRSSSRAFHEIASDNLLWQRHFCSRFERKASLKALLDCVHRRGPGYNFTEFYRDRYRQDVQCRKLLEDMMKSWKGAHEAMESLEGSFEEVWQMLMLESLTPLPRFFAPSTGGSSDVIHVPPEWSDRQPSEIDASVSRGDYFSRQYIAEEIVRSIRRREVIRVWLKLTDGERPIRFGFGRSVLLASYVEDDVPFDEGLATFSQFVSGPAPTMMTVRVTLKRLAVECHRSILDDPRLGPKLSELTPDSLQARVEGILEFMRVQGFGPADARHYHDLQNNYIHSVLESGRRTLPMSLVAIFVGLARRLGIACGPVNFPRHLLSIVYGFDPKHLLPSIAESSPISGIERGTVKVLNPFYIDVFNGGDRIELSTMLRRYPIPASEDGTNPLEELPIVRSPETCTPRDLADLPQDIAPADTASMLLRVALNIGNSLQIDPDAGSAEELARHRYACSVASTFLARTRLDDDEGRGNVTGPRGSAPRLQESGWRHLQSLLKIFVPIFPLDSGFWREEVIPRLASPRGRRNLAADENGLASDRSYLPYQQVLIGDLLAFEEDLSTGGTSSVKVRNMPLVHDPMYTVGTPFRHRMHGYLGLIEGWERRCDQSEEWIRAMRVDDLPNGGRDQPFYHVLAEDGSSRFVAECNVVPVSVGGMIPADESDREGYWRQSSGVRTWVGWDELYELWRRQKGSVGKAFRAVDERTGRFVQSWMSLREYPQG